MGQDGLTQSGKETLLITDAHIDFVNFELKIIVFAALLTVIAALLSQFFFKYSASAAILFKSVW